MTEPRKSDLIALALTPWAILFEGYWFGVGNNPIILASARRMIDPNYLPGDWVLSTPAMHPLLTSLVAGLSSVMGESWAMLLIHVATRLLLLASVGRLVFAVNATASAAVALVAMILVTLEPKIRIGGHYLHLPSWETAHLGMALAVTLMAAVIQWQRQRGTRDFANALAAGVIGGLSILSHLFIGLPLAVVAAGSALLARRPLREIIAFVVAALIVGTAAWVPAAADFFTAQKSSLSDEMFIGMLQWRHPRHHQPWTWLPIDYANAVAMLAIVCIASWRRRRDVSHAFVLTFAVYFVVTCVMLWISCWERVAPVVALFQAFRLRPLFVALAACQAAPWILDMLCARRLGRTLRTQVKRVLWVAQALAGVLLFAQLPMLALVGAWLRERRAPAPPKAWAMRRPRVWLSVVAGTGMCALVALQASPKLAKWANSQRDRLWRATGAPTNKLRAQLMRWVQENTAEDALFAIPPMLRTFRIWEKRPVILDLKHVPYRADDFAEWRRRYMALMGLTDGDPRNWEDGETADFTGESLNAVVPRPDYAIVFRREATKPPRGWRVVFENKDYLVYAREGVADPM